MVQPIEVKAQQDSIQIKGPKDTVRKGGTERDMRRIFKILREV